MALTVKIDITSGNALNMARAGVITYGEAADLVLREAGFTAAEVAGHTVAPKAKSNGAAVAPVKAQKAQKASKSVAKKDNVTRGRGRPGKPFTDEMRVSLAAYRASGMSLANCSEKMKVSVPTIRKWITLLDGEAIAAEAS